MIVSLSIAFFAGIISFISPCVLPLIPGYVSFICGTTLNELDLKSKKFILQKSLLNKKKIKFSEFDVSNNEALREKMSAMANGARSVPQIFADNIHIGDCDKIHKLEQEKKLDKLIGLE